MVPTSLPERLHSPAKTALIRAPIHLLTKTMRNLFLKTETIGQFVILLLWVKLKTQHQARRPTTITVQVSTHVTKVRQDNLLRHFVIKSLTLPIILRKMQKQEVALKTMWAKLRLLQSEKKPQKTAELQMLSFQAFIPFRHTERILTLLPKRIGLLKILIIQHIQTVTVTLRNTQLLIVVTVLPEFTVMIQIPMYSAPAQQTPMRCRKN